MLPPATGMEGRMSDKAKIHDPWDWQAGFGFSHGVETTEVGRVIEVSGQCATAADGSPLHLGDMRAQIGTAVGNIEEVLVAAGLGLGSVTRIRVYTTDMDETLANWDAVIGPFNAAGSRPASTLVGVTRLFSPDLLVEIDATARG